MLKLITDIVINHLFMHHAPSHVSTMLPSMHLFILRTC